LHAVQRLLLRLAWRWITRLTRKAKHEPLERGDSAVLRNSHLILLRLTAQSAAATADAACTRFRHTVGAAWRRAASSLSHPTVALNGILTPRQSPTDRIRRS
jgi:hypothetical protein